MVHVLYYFISESFESMINYVNMPLNTTAAEMSTEIDFKKIQEIIYWSKKWEVSPNQLIKAYTAVESREVKKIEEYLREKGFAV